MVDKESLSSLLKEVNHCQRCRDELMHEPNPILQISVSARILLIGQAPGRQAHEHSLPFSDPSGDRLRRWLGMDTASFYDPDRLAIMPMAFCFPGKLASGSGDKPPAKRCSQTWHARLRAQLNNIELTLLVGRYAAAGYLDDFQDLTTRVKEQSIEDSSVLLLPHPSPRNNIWLKKNTWFERKTLPVIRQRLQALLNK